MLRFSYFRSEDGEEWNLSGEISGAWVYDVRAVWRRIRHYTRPRQALVNLKEVTFIDEAGEQLLAEMQREGADFVTAGIEHEHLLANLRSSGSRVVGRGMGASSGGSR
jgi:anti-anti-sigma regulatory factor